MATHAVWTLLAAAIPPPPLSSSSRSIARLNASVALRRPERSFCNLTSGMRTSRALPFNGASDDAISCSAKDSLPQGRKSQLQPQFSLTRAAGVEVQPAYSHWPKAAASEPAVFQRASLPLRQLRQRDEFWG